MNSWVIVIEQQRAANYGKEISVFLSPRLFATQAEAREAIVHMAYFHRPEFPWQEQSRSVVQHDLDNFTVFVEGKASTSHFRLKIGKLFP
ncbi:MAG: hypothetical protein ACRD0P_05365 [Stackebrandtia sp.]